MVNQHRAHELMATRLLEDFRSELTGSGIKETVGVSPENRFFVSRLSSRHDDESVGTSSLVNIHQIGMDFLLKEADLSKTALIIYPIGDLFYRVLPTLQQQREYLLREAVVRQSTQADSFEQLWAEHLRDAKNLMHKFAPVYRKLSLSEVFPHGFAVDLAPLYSMVAGVGDLGQTGEVNTQLLQVLDSKIDSLIKDNNAYMRYRGVVALDDVKDEFIWNKYIERALGPLGTRNPMRPNWYLFFVCRLQRLQSGLVRVSVGLVNDTKPESTTGSDKEDADRINTLFNAGVRVEVLGACLVPTEMDYFHDDYKYDREQLATGINCTVSVDSKSTPQVLHTTLMPVFKQYRLKTYDRDGLGFAQLQKDRVHFLTSIHSGMVKELEAWKRDYSSRERSLTPKGKEQMLGEIKGFEHEIARFQLGISLITKHRVVRESFIKMNASFELAAKTSSRSYSSWRLFQIVFITSVIADIVACDAGILSEDERRQTKLDYVDLLYFPTGGGKTEAFLWVLIFNLFFDRLRGKDAGTTAILKYPLRLLSVQQVQRVANILAAAELLRRQLDAIEQGEPFTLGYYVGDANTPNALGPHEVQNIQNMSREAVDDKYRVVDVCPFCNKHAVHVALTESANPELVHICQTPGCSSGERLPIVIVDREIYARLPSVIISTVDKLAAIGYNRRFRNILGSIVAKCPTHGYLGQSSCYDRDCKEKISAVDLYDATPSLVIQDELHLIRESRGSFASHYETFIQYFSRALSTSKRPMKIIGATATISSYREQVFHLYQKEPIRFPCASPDIDKNFYSYIDRDDLHRLVVGYAPFGRAVINSVVYSLKYYRIVVSRYMTNPSLVLAIPGMTDTGIVSEDQALKLVEDYWIVLEYNNVKIDGNNVINALDDPINTELEQEGFVPFDVRKMTGDDSFQDVRKVLSEVENTKDVFNGLNLIVATSMISHGVDADRFNCIFFFGIPGNMAEYIQAYSRVGRKYAGIVFDIMRPMREKDQSYLKNFIKAHEYKDIMVEPVPINRWASRAVERTIPGIFSGLIINYYDAISPGNKLYLARRLQQAVREGRIESSTIEKELYEIYGCTVNGVERALGNQYRELISAFVDEAFERLQKASFEVQTDCTNGLRQIGFQVMNSLRETDSNLKIELR